MVTLRVYRKPQGFHLPVYQRLSLGESTTNYSWCRKLTSDIPGTFIYEVGTYVQRQLIIEYPEERTMRNRDITIHDLSKYYLYVPRTGDVFYCIGQKMDNLETPLRAHSGVDAIFVAPIDLILLQQAYERGSIGLRGQSCIIDQGTTKIRIRKVGAQTFGRQDRRIQRGDDVENCYFEVDIPSEETFKSFFVYPDGTLTKRGRVSSDSAGFFMMRQAYEHIQRTLNPRQN